MELRRVGNRVKAYRCEGGRKILMGSFGFAAVLLAEVPLELRQQLTDPELKQLGGWLRGAAKREALTVQDEALLALERLAAIYPHLPEGQRPDLAERLKALAAKLAGG